MIQIEGVSKTYGGHAKAVDQMNLHVRKGEIFGFLGPNGAGKTTTIKMMTGIIQPDAGDIYINGKSILKEPLAAKMKFGYVPDSPDLFLRLKGIEYLNFMGDVYEVSKEQRAQKIESIAPRFSMENVLNDTIQSYSHGMRQKIIIMGALMHNPDVWILDEPMTGLDPKSSFIVKEMMREHADEGNVVFFSTHILEVAEKLCDRVAIISDGVIKFCGTFNEMQQQFQQEASLEKLFLEMTSNE